MRLPGKQNGEARYTSLKLVDEVTRYPQSTTDDCVMSEWMFEWNLPILYTPPAMRNPEREKVPSWITAESDLAYAAL